MSSLNDLYPHLAADDLATEKEIKVRIPMGQHIKLHTLKVLHGQSISTTVKVALANYFREFDAERAQAQASRLPAWTEAEVLPGEPSTPH